MTAARTLALGTLVATALLAPGAAGAQAGGRRCELQYAPADVAAPPTTVLERQPSGKYNAFQGGGRGVRYNCAGQNVTMRADSAAYYGDLSTLYLIGGVRYRDETAELDADRLTYYQTVEWAVAQGNVFARLQNGSTMRGPNGEYFRPIPGTRPLERLLATNRPTLTLAESDSAGRPRPPVTVVADRVTAEGGSMVYAGGRVVITRPDIIARGDSAVVDESQEFARLMRTPQIEGRGRRPFRLDGVVIDLFSRERQLERVLSSGAAHVVSEDVDLRADTLDLRIIGNELTRAYAWGASRARATSPGRDIVADSLDVRLPGGRLREVYAIGDARIETQPDTLRIRVAQRDWLEGDSVVAHFDSLGAPADSARTPPLRTLVADGGARSYQHLAPDSGVTTRPSIHYVRGQTITVSFEERRPRRIDVTAPDSAMTTGVYLDATVDTTASRPGAAQRGAPSRPATPPAAARPQATPAAPSPSTSTPPRGSTPVRRPPAAVTPLAPERP